MSKAALPVFTGGHEGGDPIVGIDSGRSRIEMVKVTDMEIDPNVQRDHLDLRKIEHYRRNYNPDALGIVTLSERTTKNGVVIGKFILDGWHRKVLVSEVTENEGEILSRVFTGLTPQEESWIFLQLNAGNQPNLLDKFKQRLRAEEPIAVAIAEITHQFGLVVENSKATGSIQCVGALQKVYLNSIRHEFEPNLLDLTLRSITEAWGSDGQATQAVIVEGVSLFLAKHGQQVDYQFFIDKLRTYKGGPMGLHTNARANAATRGSRLPHSVADLLTDWYNKGGKRNKLPVWAAR